jgi:hypothetical protein
MATLQLESSVVPLQVQVLVLEPDSRDRIPTNSNETLKTRTA